jgi:hypothetical protein
MLRHAEKVIDAVNDGDGDGARVVCGVCVCGPVVTATRGNPITITLLPDQSRHGHGHGHGHGHDHATSVRPHATPPNTNHQLRLRSPVSDTPRRYASVSVRSAVSRFAPFLKAQGEEAAKVAVGRSRRSRRRRRRRHSQSRLSLGE